ncbi:toxin-antitoxin system YwqK family antitoxin [Fusobacterium sp. PH5-44]|uniref:toxin-antitoxin system YwqK family antitoxin n=1 Tax=unclassified Fusobacterium TaxID=2648384 RepID=UPI003D207D02
MFEIIETLLNSSHGSEKIETLLNSSHGSEKIEKDKINIEILRNELLTEKEAILWYTYEYFFEDEKKLFFFEENYNEILKNFSLYKNIGERGYNTEEESYYVLNENKKKLLSTKEQRFCDYVEILKIVKIIINSDMRNIFFKIFYFTGELMMKGEIKNGQLHGKLEKYSKNCYLLAKQNYANGIKEGEFVEYYKNHNQKMKCYYKNDYFDSKLIMYYKNRNILINANYNNGLLDGFFYAYYPNGQEFVKCIFENGNLNKLYREYNPDGRLIKELKFNEGKIKNDNELDERKIYKSKDVFSWIGEILVNEIKKEESLQEYYEHYEEKFLNDSRTIINYIYEESNRSNKFKFQENNCRNTNISEKIEGLNVIYYPNGKIKERYIVESGKINGKYEKYYNNGQVKESINYIEGIKNGKIAYYYPNGQLKKLCYMIKGKYEGICKFFYRNGTILGEAVFSQGFLINKIKKYNYDKTIKEKISLIHRIILNKTKLKEKEKKKIYFMKDLEEYFSKEIQKEELYDDLMSNKEIDEIYDIKSGMHYIYEVALKKNESVIKEKYYPNGNLKYSISFDAGKLHGKLLALFPNGNYFMKDAYAHGTILPSSKRWMYIQEEYKDINLLLYNKNLEMSSWKIDMLTDRITIIVNKTEERGKEKFIIDINDRICRIEGKFLDEKLSGRMVIIDNEGNVLEEYLFSDGNLLGSLKGNRKNEDEYRYYFDEPSKYTRALIIDKKWLYTYLEEL